MRRTASCGMNLSNQELQKPENHRFAREFAKAAQMTPRERMTYIAPREKE